MMTVSPSCHLLQRIRHLPGDDRLTKILREKRMQRIAERIAAQQQTPFGAFSCVVCMRISSSERGGFTYENEV